MLNIERLPGKALRMERCYINLAIVGEPGENADYSEGARRPHIQPQWSSTPMSLPLNHTQLTSLPVIDGFNPIIHKNREEHQV